MTIEVTYMAARGINGRENLYPEKMRLEFESIELAIARLITSGFWHRYVDDPLGSRQKAVAYVPPFAIIEIKEYKKEANDATGT